MSIRVAVVVAVLMTTGVAAQAPSTQRFEVASVRANRSDAPMQVTPTLQQGGRVLAINLPLRELIRVAYGLQENQLIIASPLGDARFDVEARAGASASREQAGVMLRSLLTERFALATHRETRQLPVFTLERVNASRLGPQMKPAGKACASLVFQSGAGAPPPPPPPAAFAGTPLGPAEAWAECPSMFFPGGWSLRSMSMHALAVALERMVRRPVIDRTGLMGLFDIDLAYVPETFETPGPGDNTGVAVGGPVDGPASSTPSGQRSSSSLVTAIREQLGLRLESGRAAVDVLVVDDLRQPTEN